MGARVREEMAEDTSAALRFVVGVGLLSVACPAFIMSSEAPPSTSNAIGLLIATVVLLGARLAWLISMSAARIFETIAVIYFYVFLGVAPLAQEVSAYSPPTTPYVDRDLVPLTVVAVGVSFFCIVAGSFLQGTKIRGRADEPTASPMAGRRISRSRLTGFTLFVGVTSAIYLAQMAPALFASRTERSAWTSRTYGDSLLGLMIGAVVMMGLLVVVAAWVEHFSQAGWTFGRRVFVFLAIAAVLVAANPISTPRYLSGTVIGGLLLSLGMARTATSRRFLMVGIVVALVAVFPVLDTFRYEESSDDDGVGLTQSFLSADFDGFYQIVNALELTQSEGIAFGWQFIGVLLFWVPRSIWATKPVDTGAYLAEFKGYGFSNLSAPLPAELLVNMGWLGLLVGSLLIGAGLRLLDRKIGSLAPGSAAGLLGAVTAFYLLILMRGSLLQAMAYLAVLLGGVLFVTAPRALSAQRRSRPR